MFSKLFKKKKQTQKLDVCDNIVASIAKCKTLHKQLILLAHPDRHPENIELAKELTQAINYNRYNYEELKNIEKRVLSELK